MIYFQSNDSRLVVFACDFFKMKPTLLPNGPVDAAYDRGAFEAIFESDRKAYIQSMLSFMQPDFRYIVNCFEYDEAEEFKGPPRKCMRDQVCKLFDGHAIQDKVTKTEILSIDDYTEYGVKWNLKWMTKIVYGIKPE